MQFLSTVSIPSVLYKLAKTQTLSIDPKLKTKNSKRMKKPFHSYKSVCTKLHPTLLGHRSSGINIELVQETPLELK